MIGMFINKDGKFVSYYWNRDLKKTIYIGTYDTADEAEYERNAYIAKVYTGEIDDSLPKTHGLPKGVYKNTNGGKYGSNLSLKNSNGSKSITRYIGTFDTIEEASKARTEFIMGLI